ncbi:MAG: DUF3604 domain-containing protein [Candidatus Hermodarchaeota archaeon]
MESKKFYLSNVVVLPSEVCVRNFCNLSINFTLNCNIPKDSYLIFRIRGGRNNKNDWYYLQPYDSNFNGFADIEIKPYIKLMPLLTTGKELSIKYLICEKEGIKSGSTVNLKIYNTLAQSLVEENKVIEVLLELPNQKPMILENLPRINVINEKFDHITIICPSTVEINEDFDILIRIEDSFKNLVQDFSEKIQLFESDFTDNKSKITDIIIEAGNKGLLREKGLKFSKSGIYVIEAYFNNEYFHSNPIMCTKAKLKNQLYWGYIHGHTLKSDGIREVDEYFKNIQNAGLDFGTVTEHDHSWETKNEDFDEIKAKIKTYHKENNFISFFGYEWGTWYSGGNGDICIYHYSDDIPIVRSDVNKYNSTTKIIEKLKHHEGNILMISHHTALRPGYRNWKYFDNSLEKLVEIYSTWGNQEYSFLEGNPLPPRYKFFGYGKFSRKRGAILEKNDSFVSDALKKGYKLGFTAGGDDHFGVYPSGSIDPDNGIYPPGIMAIWTNELTKKSIWTALNNRKCYGTTGPRVIIEFFMDKYFMGDIVNLTEDSKLTRNREITINLISPIIIERIELVRNSNVYKLKVINSNISEFNVEDNDNFNSIALNNSQKTEKFVYYYVRVFLENNNMAWSSPIWIIETLK